MDITAFRRAVSRAPKPEELAILQKLLAKHREEFRVNPANAEQLPRTGEAPSPTASTNPTSPPRRASPARS